VLLHQDQKYKSKDFQHSFVVGGRHLLAIVPIQDGQFTLTIDGEDCSRYKVRATGGGGAVQPTEVLANRER